MNDPSLTQKERDFYTEALNTATTGPASTGYGRAVNQRVRFDMFIDHVARKMKDDWWSLLDIGCGTGDLVEELMEENYGLGQYTGFDRDERMIKVATDRFADQDHTDFYEGDAFSVFDTLNGLAKKPEHDVVACIATLALKPEEWSHADSLTYVQGQILEMAQLADRMLFVTLFSPWKNKVLPDEMNVDPMAMFTWAMKEFGRVDILHSYAPHDYALLIHLDEGEWWRDYRDARQV